MIFLRDVHGWIEETSTRVHEGSKHGDNANLAASLFFRKFRDGNVTIPFYFLTWKRIANFRDFQWKCDSYQHVHLGTSLRTKVLNFHSFVVVGTQGVTAERHVRTEWVNKTINAMQMGMSSPQFIFNKKIAGYVTCSKTITSTGALLP